MAGSRAVDEYAELTIDELEELLAILRKKLNSGVVDDKLVKRIAVIEEKLTNEKNR